MTNNEYIAAHELLKKSSLTILDAVRIALEAEEYCGSDMNSIRDALRIGVQEFQDRKKSVPFTLALEESLKAKAHRRPRTLADIRQLMGRLLRENPDWQDRHLRSFSPEECNDALARTFITPRQMFKARTILGGVFTIGKKRGWCGENPVYQTDSPVVEEREITPLTINEVDDLLLCSEKTLGGECLAAVGLMLYAGIRPYEVLRLTWDNICLEEKVITLKPRHTKTGGSRHVSILPVLYRLLKKYKQKFQPALDSPLCPKNWKRKWEFVRKKAGWDPVKGRPWQEDCLRHTYASYHAKYFRDYNLLQSEMGHHSSTLLRTRYLNMKGIKKPDADRFWKVAE